MKRIDVNKYVQREKDKLRAAGMKGIKLGIVSPHEEQDIRNDFKGVGWEAMTYPVKDKETTHDAIIRAMNHKCTGVAVKANNLPKYIIPKMLDAMGVRPDAPVMRVRTRAIIDYLDECEFPYSGKTAVILAEEGWGQLARILVDRGMAVCVCSDKADPSTTSGFLCDADLVVSCLGIPNCIVRTQCLNAIVIDMGKFFQKDSPNGDFEEKAGFDQDRAWSISVDSGVDELCRLALLKNCCDLEKLTRGGK